MLPEVKQFHEQLKGGQLGSVFNHLPGVYFVVKNAAGQVMMANQFAASQCGLGSVEEMIGKTDFDLFPSEQANAYVEDDRRVLGNGESVVERIELAPDPSHSINWFVTTKLPLLSKQGKIIGLVCVARDLAHASNELRPYAQMTDALEYVRTRYASPIKVETLAALTHLSVGQFRRRFKQTFGIAPMDHVINVRIQSACRRLAQSDATVAAIAQDVGFYDHSHFTKSFRSVMGVSPSEYRLKGMRRFC